MNTDSKSTFGPLALVGGNEWEPGCESFDSELLELSGSKDVLVLPTASAYEHPEHKVEKAQEWFSKLGAKASGLMVLNRRDAEDPVAIDAVSNSPFVYIGGGSPLHLRSVLKGTSLWEALRAAWGKGAVIAGSSSGAMVLGDPMVDPRGGAFTLGLGLIEQLAIVPHHDTWPQERIKRTVQLAPRGVPIAGIDERTALVRASTGLWSIKGSGSVSVSIDGSPSSLDALPS